LGGLGGFGGAAPHDGLHCQQRSVRQHLNFGQLQQHPDISFLAGPPAPVLRTAVLQPGDGRADMGWMLSGEGDGHWLVPAPKDTLHRLVPTDRPLMEALGHVGVSREPAFADCGGELGNVGEPEGDGRGRHAKELGELGVAGAELAVILRKPSVVCPIAGNGRADDAHSGHTGD
jgi:hypothetical protein